MSVAAHPALSTSLKDAAANAKEKFVPQLDLRRAPYADEAARALNNQSALAQQKAELLESELV